MRTPDDDFDLALGFLFSEGILHNMDQVYSIHHCQKNSRNNIVHIKIKSKVPFEVESRNFYMTSSCGVCGKAAIDSIKTNSRFLKNIEQSSIKITPEIICSLPQKLKEAQKKFHYTGGMHAAAVFNSKGEFISLKEDVGRHNALDKLIGSFFIKNGLPLQDLILVVSGRASFELVQKSSMVGIPIFVAVGAPSSLAVQLAKETQMTLIGFTREDRFNVYTNPWRTI